MMQDECDFSQACCARDVLHLTVLRTRSRLASCTSGKEEMPAHVADADVPSSAFCAGGEEKPGEGSCLTDAVPHAPELSRLSHGTD